MVHGPTYEEKGSRQSSQPTGYQVLYIELKFVFIVLLQANGSPGCYFTHRMDAHLAFCQYFVLSKWYKAQMSGCTLLVECGPADLSTLSPLSPKTQRSGVA